MLRPQTKQNNGNIVPPHKPGAEGTAAVISVKHNSNVKNIDIPVRLWSLLQRL